eukprot:365139-Chlamydomonas_euryale.AAC.1
MLVYHVNLALLVTQSNRGTKGSGTKGSGTKGSGTKARGPPPPRTLCSQGCTGRAYGGCSTSGTYGYVAQTYGTSQTFQ